MAKQNEAYNKYYTRLLVSRSRQWGLGFIVLLFTFIFGYFLARDMFLDKSWIAIGTPLCMLGMLFILYPPTEQWEYRPWQAKAQQYETHFLD